MASLAKTPQLHLLCGKIAAGKSTLAHRLVADHDAILIAEDGWLSALYAGEMHSVADYVRNATRLKSAMKPHLLALLAAGVSIVLDFPANTPASRAWMREIIDEAGVEHQLHVLRVSDAECKARLRQRNQSGDHDFAASDAEFELITRYFSEPDSEEGFTVVVHA